ncbi:MAG: thiamine pyrophosphate-dependent enzyme, partial [Halobacteriales archaeon]|nr:thiamine pyrophosphate-dependent enzyme [Halobacteriales archaeon]
DTVVTVGSGNNTGFPAVFHRTEGEGRLLVNGNFGSMGYSLPAALGSAVARPDRPVLCYTGDGALLMVLQELETAVREELPVAVCVYNDAAYGIIRHRQQRDYGRETASTYESPDFVTVAAGLGMDGVTVRSEDDLDPVDDWLAAPEGPLLIDAHIIPEVTRPGFPPY